MIKIVATKLHKATILAKANRESLILGLTLQIHGKPNRNLILDIISFALAHSQNSVCLLRIEQVGLFVDASKDEFKGIAIGAIIVAKVHAILNYKASIAAAFHVALIKLTSIFAILRAFAMLVYFILAVVNVMGGTFVQIVIVV